MNKLKRYAGTLVVLVMTGVLVFGGSTALGAKRSKETPEIKTAMPWMAVVYSVVAFTGICVVAFKNPKRTHSDSD